MFEALSTALGVDNNIQRNVPVVSTQTEEEIQAKDDFVYAREKIRETIDKTTDAFDEMIEIAKASEHPRSFEVVNQIAANIKDMADSLVKLHAAAGKKIVSNQPNGQITNNNTLMVASTEELINMIRDQSKGMNDGITIEG